MRPRHLLVAALLASASALAAQDPLEPIRQLYASADYEATLAALEGINSALEPGRRTEVDRYRALCLIALGRTADADSVIERIVVADPAYLPGEDEAPRVRAAFAAVRARVLPEIARRHYATGKAAYDKKEFAEAVSAFEQSLAIADRLADDVTARDLKTLVTGFLDLSRAALAPPPPPEPPKEPEPPPPAAPPPAPPPPSDPVVIRQDLPPWNPAWFRGQPQAEFRGAVEVDIDENGNVASARIVAPVHPAYDQLLLEAALRWKYAPALRAGRPIESTKRVDVVLQPR